MSSPSPSPPIFAAFDAIRIINLPHRIDRAADMKRQLQRVGLAGDPRVAFFPAIAPADAGPFSSRGAHGGYLSFLALLREAATAGQSLLILEDDCDFVLPAIADYRPPAEWDIFYGGYVASDPDDVEGSDIIGAHCMGFSKRGAAVAAEYFARHLGPDFVVDPRAAADPGYDPAIRPPTDGAFVWMRRAHPELKTAFAQVAIQRASRTDIGPQRFFDRVPILRDMVETVRRLRRIIRPTPEMTRASFDSLRP